VETAGGVRFITTELIEGKTLDEFVAPGLPLAATLELFLPLLGALGAAHAQGIIHRDLKPANIMVTGDNFVKLLDFGVAVFKGPPAATVDTQTDTKALTAPGRLLGTIPYMSPEQVKGERVDQRTDLFSLGVVLYEVLTGTRPFRGRTAAELLSAILRDKPPLVTAVRPDLPRGIARIVARCLEKDPAYRYASARDLRDEVDGVVGTLDLEPSSTPSALSRLLARFRRS
jgi:serine/threonine protein kinase